MCGEILSIPNSIDVTVTNQSSKNNSTNVTEQKNDASKLISTADVQEFLERRYLSRGLITEDYFSSFLDASMRRHPISLIEEINFTAPKPYKRNPQYPKGPPSPSKPYRDRPLMPELVPVPSKPIKAKNLNFFEQFIYAFKYMVWERDFKKSNDENELRLKPYYANSMTSEWRKYDAAIASYQSLEQDWRRECREIDVKNNAEFDQALSIWNRNNNYFDQRKRKAILILKDYETQASKGNSNLMEKFLQVALTQSPYPDIIAPRFRIKCDVSSNLILIDLYVTSFADLKVQRADGRRQPLALKTHQKLYDKYIYGVILRTLIEVIRFDFISLIENIAVNVKTNFKSPSTGLDAEANLASIMVSVANLKRINVAHVDAEAFFRRNNGVAASVLADAVDVPPIMNFDRNDDRFVDGRSIIPSKDENIAEMDWEDFEHLVRQLFELHFKGKNAEVKVTRSSRDRGVDAVVFDPDPITGGKIIVQAKRYTNTVEVAAVRELFGTTQNEGANKGILVTTSNYGADSYEFARDKNLTLINGPQFLDLLKQYGFAYKLDIEQARKNIARNRRVDN